MAWVDRQGAIPFMIERLIDRDGLDHVVTHFHDHADFLEAHRAAPFDVAVLRTTEPDDPLSANAVVGLLRRESPRTVFALCSGCRVEPGPSDGTPCSRGIRSAHNADPDLFDRFIPKPFRLPDVFAWLDALERAALSNRS